MPVKTSGPLSFNTDIVGEFGFSGDRNLTKYYRGGVGRVPNASINANVPTSGEISFSDFYGAANAYAMTLVGNILNANIRSLAISDGWDGNLPLIVEISSGSTLYSNSTSQGGAILAGSFPNGVIIENDGAITGMGGSAGGNGGPALQITTSDSVEVNNNSGAFIAGGGGGGGGTGGGGGAGQAPPGQAGSSGGSYTVSSSSCGSVTFGCSEGGTVVASCCGPSSVTLSTASGGNQGAYGGPGGYATGSGGSCVGSGTGGGPPPCSVSGISINYGGVILPTGRGGQGGSILSATSNVTISGGGWGAAGTGSGAGSGGAAISGSYATLTNNGTIYGST